MISKRGLLLIGALLAAACDGTGPAGLPDLTVAIIDVQPGNPTLVAGETVSLTAYPKTTDGTVLGSVEIEWTVDAPERVTFVADGFVLRVTGIATGPVVVTAGGGGKTGQTTVTITPGAVAAVTLDVDSLALAEGGVRQLSATATDAHGNVITGKYVEWRSTDPEVAHVDALGLVTGIRTGTVELTARVDGDTARSTVGVFADYAYDLLYTAWSEPSSPALFRLDVRDPDATGTRIIPATFTGSGAAASPDGARIAFSGSSPDHGAGIFVMSRDGSGLALIDSMGTPSCGQISWSPDGQKLAYMCHFSGTDSEIVTIGSDGGNRTVLSGGDTGNRTWPTWSPMQEDGSYRIAYVRVVDGSPGIWTMKSDGTDERQLTSGYDDMPAWSPDGSTIVFQRIGATIFADLYLVDADGENVRPLRLTALAGAQSQPKWSPDGRLIAFASTHETYGSGTGAAQIYTIWADGTKLARRTSGEQEKLGPAWGLR